MGFFFLQKEIFSFLFCFTGVGLPHLLEVTEGFPESRTGLAQQLHQRVAEEFGSCRFGVEVEGSRSKAINHNMTTNTVVIYTIIWTTAKIIQLQAEPRTLLGWSLTG